MIEYIDIKDKIIYQDWLATFTIDDCIKELQEAIDNQIKFEKIVYDILKNNNFDNETLVTLFSKSQTDDMRMIIRIIKDEQ